VAPILSARVHSEFGDDPTRFTETANRRAYAGVTPRNGHGRIRPALQRSRGLSAGVRDGR
jgi:hypothetical protein